MASRLSVEPAKMLDTLKQTVFKNASNEECMALVVVANEYDLNPFLKELYAFPAKGGGIVPIVSVDGWNKMLIRQPGFDGIGFEFTEDEQGFPISCTATVHIKGRGHPTVITEYYAECQRNTDNWKNMPRRMLRNRTLCQAARMAFGFSGVHHEEEVPPGTVDIESTVVVAEAASPKLVAAPSDQAATAQQELEAAILTAGHTFTDFQKWGEATANVPMADSLTSFADMSSEVCRRLLRAKAGMLTQIADMKKASV